jgi:hypothetical protein
MKLKENSNTILKIVTMYCVLYLINLPEVLKYSDPNLLFKTNLLILLDIFVISSLSTFIPCIHYLNRGKKLDYKVGKRICMANTFIILVVGLIASIYLIKDYGYFIIISTILGSFIFYYINMLLYVEYKATNNYILNIISYTIIMISVLTILIIGIMYVRTTVDPPTLRIQNDYNEEYIERP